MKSKLILLVCLIWTLLISGCTSIEKKPNLTSAEEKICTLSKLPWSEGIFAGTYEMMQVDKCVVNGNTLYQKEENIKEWTDSNKITYYDEEGNKICEHFRHGDCSDELNKWNPNFVIKNGIIENCEWEKICSAGGW